MMNTTAGSSSRIASTTSLGGVSIQFASTAILSAAGADVYVGRCGCNRCLRGPGCSHDRCARCA
eukprot:1299530-Rhodomonas_salina.1